MFYTSKAKIIKWTLSAVQIRRGMYPLQQQAQDSGSAFYWTFHKYDASLHILSMARRFSNDKWRPAHWHTGWSHLCMPEKWITKKNGKTNDNTIRYSPLWPCIFYHIFLKWPHSSTICCHNVFYCGVLVLVICPHSVTWLTRHQPSLNLKAHWF